MPTLRTPRAAARALARTVAALLSGLAACAPSGASGATPTGDEMLVRALAVSRSLPLPANARYRVDYRSSGALVRCAGGILTTSFDSNQHRAAYDVAYDASAGAESVDLATGERCRGVPLISPDGGDLGELLRAQPRALPRTAPDAAHLPVIGDARAVGSLAYRVVSVEDVTLDGTAATHLMVRAYDETARAALTDLWIDPATYAVRRAAATFADRYGGVGARIDVSGDFAAAGSFLILVREHVAFAAPTSPQATEATIDAFVSGYDFGATPAPGPSAT